MLWVKNRDEMCWGTVQHGKKWQTWLWLASMLSHFNRINKICEHKFFSESTQVPETQNLSTQVAANAMHVLHDMNYSYFVRNLTKNALSRQWNLVSRNCQWSCRICCLHKPPPIWCTSRQQKWNSVHCFKNSRFCHSNEGTYILFTRTRKQQQGWMHRQTIMLTRCCNHKSEKDSLSFNF